MNLGVFDLLGVPPADNDTPDSTAGLNVHTVAIEVPISALTANRNRPSSASDPGAILGVWSTASRPSVTTRTGAEERHNDRFLQVSRLGQPLVNSGPDCAA